MKRARRGELEALPESGGPGPGPRGHSTLPDRPGPRGVMSPASRMSTEALAGRPGPRGTAAPPGQHEPLAPGTRIHHYEIIRELGQGGMGAVYLARDTKLGRRVAIKLMQRDRPSFTERFIVEARNTARCSHENIVVIHDVSEFQGNPFMVLEYLKGQTLHDLAAGERMPVGRVVQLMAPVLRALACAHEHQIIHRDLKPDNIFVTESGAIKVLDFGISKLVHESALDPIVTATATTEEILPPAPRLTQRGALIGTLPYLSPEQWNGEELDYRSDLWAVGIILYQLVVGKHPLSPLSWEQLLLTGVLEQPMPSAHDASVAMPPALADIIDGCLQKYRDNRIAGATEVLAALERLLPGREGRELGDAESPYTGLTAFQEADANRFFGRSRDIAAVIARLPEHPLIGVIGPSGVGKSSFVRAGVIPALKHSGDAWESFVVRPGRQPVAALVRVLATVVRDRAADATDAADLPDGDDAGHLDDLARRLGDEPGFLGASLRDRARRRGCKIALFVDQFEELYTLTPDAKERLRFTQALLSVADDPSSPLRVFLSIRSDFLDRVAEDGQFMAELDEALYFLVQPDREGLREAIVRPAELVGYRFETPSIVDEMLDQLEASTGALPLLQFAASKLWDGRDVARKRLTQRAYQELGGVEGALASHANAVLSGLTPQEQTLVRAIFLQLVTPARTRAIASVNELRELWHEPEVMRRLVDELVDARLLVTQPGEGETGSLVEIVHESLIHSWPMLDHWLDEHAEDAPYLDQIEAAARQWDRKGRPSGLLWRGEAAAEAEMWYRRYRGLLLRVQADYLHAVLELAAHGRRRKRLLVGATISVLSLLVVAAGVGLLVVNDARKEARAAESAALKAESAALEKERTIRRQYDELQAEKMAKQQAKDEADTFRQRADEATTQVELSKDQLQAKNRELTVALDQAHRNEEVARKAAELALRKTEEARRAKDELEVLYKLEQERLDREQARVKELERELGAKRSTKLN
ncbi:nSTAND1 domain-containing NTPase [Sorangium sp. So ce854]|uniref:serine/threonine-protein kinase n=1 Tax=Sorangium sp. So ce854 TaxID=3133322 RepID=UPI003F60F19F